MTAPSKVTKGYIKTENMILIIFISLSLGFLGGVVFSALRSTPAPANSPNRFMPQISMTPEQKRTLETLIAATKTPPDNVNAFTRLGHFYFDSGQYDKAIEAYEKSLALDGNRPDVWTDLGVMYRRSGKPDKAIESFNQAISLNQRHENAIFNKGVVLMHDKNNPKAALAAWDQLLRINPHAKTPSGQPVKNMVDELKKQHS